MGAPSSAVLFEVFLQYMESSHIATISKKTSDYRLLSLRRMTFLLSTTLLRTIYIPSLQIVIPSTPAYTERETDNTTIYTSRFT
jgi:hypothetical protein